jgi:hypothetical protein
MPTPPKASVTEKRFADIVASLRRNPAVTAPSSDSEGRGRKSFGSSGLKVKNKVFAMVASRGEFVVKLPRERVDALVASPGHAPHRGPKVHQHLLDAVRRGDSRGWRCTRCPVLAVG